MKTLAIIGATRSASSFYSLITQATDLGYQVLVADTKENFGFIADDKTLYYSRVIVETLSCEAILAKISRYQLFQVLAFTEFNQVLAAKLREKLKIKGISSETESLIRDKYQTRIYLSQAGYSHIKFTITDLANLENTLSDFRFPVIVKPKDLTGSIGVCLVQNQEDVIELKKYYSESNYLDKNNEHNIIIEEFILGEEVSVEGLVVNSTFYLLAITDKRTTGSPYFIEVGHTVPSKLSVLSCEIEQYIQRIVNVFHLQTCPIHAELKINNNGYEIIEIHTRYGGDCITKLLFEAYGYEVYKMLYQALDFGTPPHRYLKHAKIANIQFIMAKNSSDENKIQKAIKISKDLGDLLIYNDNYYPTSPFGLTMPYLRLGQIIFSVNTYEELVSILEAGQFVCS